MSAKIDGGQRIGMVIMRKAVDLAIQKAKVSGMSVVGLTNYASATGALGVWGRDIARQGLIGFVFSQVCKRAVVISCPISNTYFLQKFILHLLLIVFLCATSSQCPEMVAPYGSYEPLFGTNPFTIGIPTSPRPQVQYAIVINKGFICIGPMFIRLFAVNNL